MELVLECKQQTAEGVYAGGAVMVTPPLDESYWSYRVKLSDTQAMLGFPKFGTVGIGFAVEDDDWNTNLPYTCTADEIFRHIERNKGDESISNLDCIEAIRMIQTQAVKDKGRTT